MGRHEGCRRLALLGLLVFACPAVLTAPARADGPVAGIIASLPTLRVGPWSASNDGRSAPAWVLGLGLAGRGEREGTGVGLDLAFGDGTTTTLSLQYQRLLSRRLFLTSSVGPSFPSGGELGLGVSGGIGCAVARRMDLSLEVCSLPGRASSRPTGARLLLTLGGLR